MIPLTPNISYLTYNEKTDRPVLGYIRGSRRSLMFDAGNSSAHVQLYLRRLNQEGLPAPDLCVISHWHWDHSFGMSALKERGVLTIAAESTDRKLREVSAWSWDEAAMEERLAQGKDIAFVTEMIKEEYPDRQAIRVECADVCFSDSLTLDLGGLHCRLLLIGGPHSRDSVVCHIPEEKILFLGDSAGADLYETLWNYTPQTKGEEIDSLPYDPDRLRPYLRRLRAMDFETAVRGHGEPVSKTELIAELSKALLLS